MYQGAAAKLTIASVDADLSVAAYFNPKELQIDQGITWTEHESPQAQDVGLQVVEFGGVGMPTLKVELLFDGAERKGQLDPARYGKEATVTSQIDLLKLLASPIDPYSSDEELRRPHFCVLTWGFAGSELSGLRCVIESISVKYTMFAHDGTVLRAVVTLGLKQADRVARYREGRRRELERSRRQGART